MVSSKSMGTRASSTMAPQLAQRGDRVAERTQHRRLDRRWQTARAASAVMRMPRTSGAPASAAEKSTCGAASVAASRSIVARHRGSQQRGVLDGVRQRPERIERERQRHDAREADEPVRRLEPGEAAKRRGNANRASCVGADRGGRESARHRNRRAAARAAGDAMRARVPRIPRRAHRLVAAPAAERKFDHVRLAERNHAGREQTIDGGRGFRRDASVPRLGARGRHAALDVQQVLERDRQAVQRTAGEASLALQVGRAARRRERLVAVDLDVRVQASVERVSARRGRLRRSRGTS